MEVTAAERTTIYTNISPLAQRVNNYIQTQHSSIAAVAKDIGYSRTTVSRYLTGKYDSMKKTLAQDFPHLKLPAAVFATIDSAAKSDAFDIEELIVHNEVTGEVFKAHITSYWYEYKLTVIDRFGNPDANYPALPGIKSKKQFKAGAVVAVALPYGDLTPAIIGEVEL